MKKLELSQMENLDGGKGGASCYWAIGSVLLCGVSAVLSEGGSLLLFGAEATSAVAGVVTSC